MSQAGKRQPYRHRSPGKRWLQFERATDDDPKDEQPMRWLRRVIASSYVRLEEHMGTRIVREERMMGAPLGCGLFGCVFDLEDGRVLKITSDQSEGPMTWYVKGLQERKARTSVGPVLSTTARIDDVFAFPDKVVALGRSSTIYGIVRERTGPGGTGLDHSLVTAANAYTDGWDAYCEAEIHGARIIGAAIARAGIEALRESNVEGKRLAGFLELAWASGIPFMDIHAHNLALREQSGPSPMRRDQVVIFDFGGSVECMLPSPRGSRRRRIVVQDAKLLQALREEIPTL